MTAIANAPRAAIFPALNATLVMTALISGAVATMAFDLWGQVVAPWLGLGALAPEGLARALLGTLGLPNGRPEGNFMHLFVVGLVAYPLGYLLAFRPAWRHLTGDLGWIVPSLVYGAALWVVAIGGVTTIANGVKPFLGFAKIAWVALAGHVLYGFVAGWMVNWLERRAA